MESSSKVYGDHRTEECQSSESGWTMYIGSSIDDDDDDDNGKKGSTTIKDEEDEDTDDSMTSDASSGPSHLHLQQDHETDGKQHNQENYMRCSASSKKISSKKGARKNKQVGYEESRKLEEESLVNNEKKGVIKTVQSGNRAWFLGKRK